MNQNQVDGPAGNGADAVFRSQREQRLAEQPGRKQLP